MKLPLRIILEAGEGNNEVVAAWLDGGRRRVDATYDLPDGSSRGRTLLMHASANGHERLVEMLLQRGAALDLQDSDGDTALMSATFCGHPAIVRRLLRAGASTGLRDKHGGKTAQQ